MDFENLSTLECEHFDRHRFSSNVCSRLRISSNQSRIDLSHLCLLKNKFLLRDQTNSFGLVEVEFGYQHLQERPIGDLKSLQQ